MKSMKTEIDQMPRETAIALLTSNQRMTGTFRRTCLRATERIVEPVSRSTRLNISAPATPLQKFERKLRKANAKQLTTWLRRATRRGERLQDLLFDTQCDGWEEQAALLQNRIGQMDAIGQAILAELDKRQSRGEIKNV